MNISGLKEKISSTFKKVVDFFKKDKRRSLIILLSTLIFLLVLLLIISIAKMGNKKETEENHPVVFTEELLIPNGPEAKEDYSVSRVTEEEWSEEETENWFTIPSSKEVENLSNANEKLINDVIGAAP